MERCAGVVGCGWGGRKRRGDSRVAMMMMMKRVLIGEEMRSGRFGKGLRGFEVSEVRRGGRGTLQRSREVRRGGGVRCSDLQQICRGCCRGEGGGNSVSF